MKYVIIVGGQLHNKGAQAMTFTVVNEIKKKYPEKEVILFASTYDERDEEEKRKLKFKVYPWPLRAQMDILKSKTIKYVGSKEYFKYLIKGSKLTHVYKNEIKNILKNADLMIDISGYALSSQRGYLASIRYFFNIMIAKDNNIPIILYPQSFGPFDYPLKEKKKIFNLIKKYLNYPVKIYVREKDGIEQLTPFNLKNIYKTYDSVLQNQTGIVEDQIYLKGNFHKERIAIKDNSIALIPNVKIMKHGNENKQYEIYKAMIEFLLNNNKNVYLIRHSFEDFSICEKIKIEFKNEPRVVFLKQDLNCIQIDDILAEFDFVIASRYHAIIHSYRNGKPTLVFGWAIKYQELLNRFNQEKFLFDVRENLKISDVLDNLSYMLKNFENESKVIKQELKSLEKIDLLKY